MNLKIFYSWESDLPKAINQKFIKHCLQIAISEIEKESEISLILEESTSNVPGSPNIPNSIYSKISGADIFLSDISIIGKIQNGRSTPNPNVLFETGFAVANLGLERVILLVNTEFGKIEDLPFDLKQLRIIQYKLTQTESGNKSSLNNCTKQLSDILKLAIETIIREAPSKQINESEKELALKKTKDSELLKETLLELNIKSIEKIIESGPIYLPESFSYSWLGLEPLINSLKFHFYDEYLEKTIRNIYKILELFAIHHDEYRELPGGHRHIFENANMNKERQEIFDVLNKSVNELRINVLEFLRYIRRNYLNIDIDEISRISWNQYIESEIEIQKAIDKQTK